MIKLNEKEAVKFGDNLLVRPMGTIKFITDGEEIVTNICYSSEPVSITTHTKVYKMVSGKSERLSHYTTNNTIVSKEDFFEKLREFNKKYSQFLDDYTGEYDFCGDIETEYAFKKGLKNINDTHIAIYEVIEPDWELIQFNIIGELCDTKSPYITNALSIGKKSFNNDKYLKVDLSHASYDKFIELSKKYSSEKVVFFSDEKYLRFAKINGKFLFNDYFDKNKFFYCCSLEQAHEEVRMIQDKVEKIVIDYLFPTGIDKPTAQTLIYNLVDISKLVNNLDVKKNNSTNQRHVSERISKLVNELELYVNIDREKSYEIENCNNDKWK